jgi:hypothetical protein
VYPIFPVSLDCLFLISPSVSYNVSRYLILELFELCVFSVFDLNYNAPAVTYTFPIIYYEFAMLICSATPNRCLGELLENKGLSRISLFICFVNG